MLAMKDIDRDRKVYARFEALRDRVDVVEY
jgi:hypothetical protein